MRVPLDEPPGESGGKRWDELVVRDDWGGGGGGAPWY